MNLLYKKQLTVILAAVALTGTACGQNAKVKTITIINGDTTISEKNMDEKELAEIDKKISIVINEDGDSEKIIKTIIISDEKTNDGETMAYAYSHSEEKDEDVEVTTDNDGKKTKVIIKKRKDEKGNADTKEKTTVIRKSMSSSESSKDDKKESLKLNIMIKNTTAKIDIETGSKEPLNISILDENGKQVFYDSQKSGSKYSKEILLEKKGTYFLNIIQNKKTTNEKIVIE